MVDSRLVSSDADHDFTLSFAHVGFGMKDLLLRPQRKLPIRYRSRKRRAKQCCLQVRMTVAIRPHLLVTVVAARGNKFVEDRGQIALQSGFELNRSHRRRAANIKHVYDFPF